MEITIKLEDSADISSLKKLLSQFSGIKSVEINNEKIYSWEEIESSEDFLKVMEQSEQEYKLGQCKELTEDVLDEIFNEK